MSRSCWLDCTTRSIVFADVTDAEGDKCEGVPGDGQVMRHTIVGVDVLALLPFRQMAH